MCPAQRRSHGKQSKNYTRCWWKEEEEEGVGALTHLRPQKQRNGLAEQAGSGDHLYSKSLVTPAGAGRQAGFYYISHAVATLLRLSDKKGLP